MKRKIRTTSKSKSFRLPVPFLRRFMTAVFKEIGVPEKEAALCTDVLIEADCRGIDSHGINRCKPMYYDRVKVGMQFAKTKVKVIRQGPTTAVLDGCNGMGQVIAHHAMSMAIRKAARHGLGMVAVRRSSHYGIAGYWTDMAAAAGMIGVTGTNARPSIAPTFGVENMLGTNPLAFALPTDEPFPFSLDCATSVAQRGKIEHLSRLGKTLPAGWVADRKGRPVTSASGALAALTAGTAALLPLGGAGEDGSGYKGYGYATLVEILSAALAGGPFMKGLTGLGKGKTVPIDLGHFFLAISIESFISLKEFKRTAGSILRALRASARAPGCRRIYTAGEKEYFESLKRRRSGILVNPGVQRELSAMRDELALKRFQFPWD